MENHQRQEPKDDDQFVGGVADDMGGFWYVLSLLLTF
jgi:hypothetical protein